jgi:hypothetical protein
MTSNGKADHFEGWKREFSPKTVAIEDIVLDGELVLELERAQAELAKAKEDTKGTAMLGAPSELQERVDKIQSDVDSKRHSLVVKSIGRRAWRDLIEAHWKTPKQTEDEEEDKILSPFTASILATSGLSVDPETFPQAALATSTVEIDGEQAEMSLDFAEWIYEVVADDERARLLTACLEANLLQVKAPKVATEKVPTGERK